MHREINKNCFIRDRPLFAFARYIPIRRNKSKVARDHPFLDQKAQPGGF